MTLLTKYPENILLAVDESEHAFAATELLRDLPLTPSNTITAISVLIPRHAQFSTAIHSVLEQTEKILAGSQANIKTELIAGYPSEMINQCADELSPDLIVVGAKGLRATLGILLGGVAQQVVEYSCCPVLVVRAPYRQLTRILLVTDGSSYSKIALQYLGQFLLPENTDVHVLHVLPPTYHFDFVSQSWPTGVDLAPLLPMEDIEERMNKQAALEQQEGEKLLEKSIDGLQQYGIEAQSVLRRGDAASQILEYAKNQDVDLIVAGSRGLSQIQGWLLGSVSRKLVHYANCSVLIVKSTPEQKN